MKLKNILAGFMAAVTAVSTFLCVSLSANSANTFVLVNDVAEQICERKDYSTLKNGESINIKLKNPQELYDYNSNKILSGGWYYKIPVSSNGRVVINITANGGSGKNVCFINSEIKNYKYKSLEDSNDFITTQIGEECYGYILYGNKNEFPKVNQHQNDDILVYYAALQCKDYSGTFTFDVKKGNYFFAIYPDDEIGDATLTVTYPSAKENGTDDSKSVSISTVTVSPISNNTYTGKAITPIVTVKDGDKKLVKSTDYTVSYKNNTKIGTATVTISGKGDYTGTKTLTFKIVPKKVKLTGKSSGTKENLSWKKSAGAAGYEVYRSIDGGKFTRLTATKTLKYTAKLTAGKSYKFKVRPYATVNGKKVYGSWSNVVSVK